MDAMLGVVLLSASALLYAWSYGQFRRPRPRAWTQSGFSATTITLTIVFLLGFSLAFLGNSLQTIDGETNWLEIAAVAGGSIAVCWLLIPRFVAPAAGAEAAYSVMASSSAVSLPEPANDPEPTSPSQSGSPKGRPAKRRVA